MSDDLVVEQVAERLYEIAVEALLPVSPKSEWSSWAKLGAPHKAVFRKQAAGAVELVREIVNKAIDQ